MDVTPQADWQIGNPGCPLLLRDRRTPRRPAEEPSQADDAETRQAPRRLRCGHCGHPITDDSQRFEMDGRHTHRFTNPAGITYELGCFLDAPGVVRAGQPIHAYSWFVGYAWRIVHCSQCRLHLGWDFTGEREPPGFYGLILDRLASHGFE